MNWPPYLLKIRLENEDRSLPIWLPLFIIGPVVLILLLAIFIISLPFLILALIFNVGHNWWRTVFLAVPAFYRLITQLPGLKIDAESAHGRVFIIFI